MRNIWHFVFPGLLQCEGPDWPPVACQDRIYPAQTLPARASFKGSSALSQLQESASYGSSFLREGGRKLTWGVQQRSMHPRPGACLSDLPVCSATPAHGSEVPFSSSVCIRRALQSAGCAKTNSC